MKKKKLQLKTKKIILLIVVICFVPFVLGQTCGNGVCEEGETNENCTGDCFTFGLRQLDNPAKIDLSQELGADWGTTNFYLYWGRIENPRGVYDWSKLDAQMEAMQSIGLYPYVILACYSDWATPDCYIGGKEREQINCLPSPEYIQDWKNFVSNLVERYDYDGIGDEPDWLKIPINHYQLSEEWTTAWTPAKDAKTNEEVIAATQDYVDLLGYTSVAAKSANPNAKIMTAGLTTSYRFVVYADGYINDIDGGLRFGVHNTISSIKSSFNYYKYNYSMREIIKSGNFDYYTIHSFEEKDTFLEAKIKWLKDRFAEYGQTDKQILLSGGNGPFTNSQEEIDCMDASCNVIQSLIDDGTCPNITKYDGDCSFPAWTMAKQSAFIVKMYSIAISNDVVGPPWNLGTTEIIDYEDLSWNGPFVNSVLINGGTVGKKPGFYTYKLMTSKLKGFSSIQTIENGEGKGVYKYTVDNKPIIVAWNNNGDTINLSPYVSTPNVKITRIVTELDGNNNPIYPADEIVSANSIQIDDTPIFIGETSEEPTSVCGNGICEEGEDFISCSQDCKHPADINEDNEIDITEIMNYIWEWKNGEVIITKLMESIGIWKAGGY